MWVSRALTGSFFLNVCEADPTRTGLEDAMLVLKAKRRVKERRGKKGQIERTKEADGKDVL